MARKQPEFVSSPWTERWFSRVGFSGARAVAVRVECRTGVISGPDWARWFLRDYGWGLFTGIPFCMGFLAALIHGARQRRRLRESLFVAFLSIVNSQGRHCLVPRVRGSHLPLDGRAAGAGAWADRRIGWTRRASQTLARIASLNFTACLFLALPANAGNGAFG